ncbi:transposase, partial [Streptomyces sp. DSM 40473]
GRTAGGGLGGAGGRGPEDDGAQATASQLRRVVTDLIEMGRWHVGDRDILIVFDAGYDAPRMAHLLDGLPVEVLGRMRSDRVMRRPTPSLREYPLAYPQGGRPPKHGKEFRFRTPGVSRTRPRRRSPTGTASHARWPGTASTPA